MALFFIYWVCTWIWKPLINVNKVVWEHFVENCIEVYFRDHKTPSFRVYNSIIFSNFKEWYNHHHKSTLEHFHSLDKNPQEHAFKHTQGCAGKPSGRGVAQISGVCLFPWYKYSYHGQCQAAKSLTISLQNSWKLNNQLEPVLTPPGHKWYAFYR